MRRAAILSVAFLLVAGGALVGCGGSSDDGENGATTTSGAPTTTTGDETTTTVVDNGSDTGEGAAEVDLEFTGTYVFSVHDATGACLGFGGRFAFEMTGTDVAGIGNSFSVAQLSGTSASMTWVIDDNNAYAGSGEEGGVIAAEDGTSVQIDDDLVSLNSQSTDPRPEHVEGTITCP